MQTMCVGQGAMLGVLLGIGLVQSLALSDYAGSVAPFALALVASGATYAMSEHQVAVLRAARNTHFAAMFAALLACGYLVSALFPALDSHMAQKYFGDLATVSKMESLALLFAGSAALILIAWRSNSVSRRSFETMILCSPETTLRGADGLFAIGSLILICLSVQIAGFLFTVACLFVPTALAVRTGRSGLRRHLVRCGIVAALACLVGFMLSLRFSQLPTVPAIVATMVLIGSAQRF